MPQRIGNGCAKSSKMEVLLRPHDRPLLLELVSKRSVLSIANLLPLPLLIPDVGTLTLLSGKRVEVDDAGTPSRPLDSDKVGATAGRD